MPLTCFDDRPKEFSLQYDSSYAVKDSGRQSFGNRCAQPIQRTAKWRTVTFLLPRAHFSGYTSGVSFRLACRDAELVVARIEMRHTHATTKLK